MPLAADTQKLKVFISWAGDRANAIGKGFHDFLPDVVNAVQPFMSGMNIDKGTRWGDVLNGTLQESSCAIVCITRESINSIWVAFEAGAISRAAGGTDGARYRIWTYLSGLESKDLQLTPFAEYQATDSTQDETFRLVQSINTLSPDPVSADSLKRRFDALFWPSFSEVLVKAAAISTGAPVMPSNPDVKANDMLSEILRTLRSLQREIRRPERSGGSAGTATQNIRIMLDRIRDATGGTYRYSFSRLGDGLFELMVGQFRRTVSEIDAEILLQNDIAFATLVDEIELLHAPALKDSAHS